MVMISRRLNELSAVVLMVYLSAVVGGGLHHHEPAESGGYKDCAVDGCFSAGDSRQVLSHDESDDCTVCTASHQAKTPPAVILLAETYRVVGDCRAFPVQSGAVSIPRITQARAPPLV
jgi:hypothetical protein